MNGTGQKELSSRQRGWIVSAFVTNNLNSLEHKGLGEDKEEETVEDEERIERAG